MLLHKPVVNDWRVRREAEALAEAGHEVTLLELAPPGAELLGLRRVSVLPPRWVRRTLGRVADRAWFAGLFVLRAAQGRPDVIHAHDAAMLAPALLAARASGAALVYDSHEFATGVPYRERGWERMVEAIERVALPRCAAVITVSDGIADRLREKYALPERPVVVRNVCSLPRGHSPVGLRERLRLRDEPLVLHQGAAARDRGCDVLLKAVAGISGAHLCFLGDGDPGTLARLRIEARAFGIDERVHFLPSVPGERLLELTAAADVGVSLLQDTCENHRQALPNKLFEYLAAGVPVVVSDLPQTRALVEAHGVGWWAAPDDHDSVRAALLEAIARRGDVQLRARVEAASRELSWERERRVLQEVYAAVGERKTRRWERKARALASSG